MVCQGCGARNRDEALFCTSCGERLALFSPAAPEGASEAKSDAARDEWPGSPDAAGQAREQGFGTYGQPPYPATAHFPPSSQPEAYPWNGSPAGLVPYVRTTPQPYGPVGLAANNIVCSVCGLPRPSRLETCPYCGRAIVNNSGKRELLPAELASGWNWGAFMFPLLWSITHETWFGLLALVPGLHIVMGFVLASRGNEIAWQNRRFQSVEQFQEVQKAWRNAAIGGAAVMAAVLIICLFSM